MTTPNPKRKPGRPRKAKTESVQESPAVGGTPDQSGKDGPTFPPLPDKVRILVGSLSYDGQVHQDTMAYVSGMFEQMRDHPRLGELRIAASFGYPCDRVRNDLTKKAADNGFHLLLMLDNDMKFDALLGRDPKAKPFLRTAFDFMLAHDGPCLVGAPYTGGPPDQRVMVMRWRDSTPDATLGEGMKLESFTREEAAERDGFERVAGLPTGSLLIDLRCLAKMPPPWFYYEFADPPFNTKLASTEDIVFSRNADWLGIPSYINWSSWAGHYKNWLTGKPRFVDPNDVPRAIWQRAVRGDVPPQFAV